MAEVFFNHLAKGEAIAISADTRPAEKISATAVAAMKEIGIDMRHQKPKLLTLEMVESADRVITMGCGVEETCPASFVPTEDWQLADPRDKPLEEVRKIRDEIRARVKKLVKELCPG